jgi:hypothetical protein
VTLAFSVLTRWLRDAAAGRPGLAWLQLAVPIPAFVILVTSIVPFAVLKSVLDPTPGGGMALFLVTLAGFVAVAGWGVLGPDRGRPNGDAVAIIDLRAAFLSRLAIHVVFLTALLLMGLATREPVLLATALLMIGAEAPLAILTERRHAARAPRTALEAARQV